MEFSCADECHKRQYPAFGPCLQCDNLMMIKDMCVCVCVCVCVGLVVPPTAGKAGLEKEQEFISKCMESLLMASANLEKDALSSLTVIERGLLMLKTHLEACRRRS